MGVKNENFQILIKWPEMILSGCYIAQNVRNEQTDPKIYVISHVSYWKYENSTKKSPGVQNPAKYFFVTFGFLSFLVKIKIFVFQNLYSKTLVYFPVLLSVSASL